jgi:hypothetical protein
MTADDFREIALAFDDAIESAHMGHPDFRAAGRIFATLNADETTGGLKLTPEEQQALMASHPAAFSPASGAWGRGGWTMVRLESVDRPTARGALLLAWQNVVNAPRRKAAPKASRAAATSSARTPRPRRRRS